MAAMALVVAAPSVLAQSEAPQDASGTIKLKANDKRYPGSCDFPLQLELSGKGKTIELPGGVFILTSPGLDVTLTNLDNGNQETFNITGSVSTTTEKNGDQVTTLTGRNFAIDPEAGTVIAIGNFSFTFDKKGNLVQPLEGEGQLIDVCELLA
jgi:hypothetical protein